MAEVPTILRPDAKGRITLGKLAKGVSSFRVKQDKHHRIILEPYTEIPARERWLFENPEALEDVLQGVAASAAGRVKYLGSFAQYANESEDED